MYFQLRNLETRSRSTQKSLGTARNKNCSKTSRNQEKVGLGGGGSKEKHKFWLLNLPRSHIFFRGSVDVQTDRQTDGRTNEHCKFTLYLNKSFHCHFATKMCQTHRSYKAHFQRPFSRFLSLLSIFCLFLWLFFVQRPARSIFSWRSSKETKFQKRVPVYRRDV